MDGEDKLLSRFAQLMEDQTHEPTKKEVSAVAAKYFAQKKKTKKTAGAAAGADEQKAKRAPSAYNMFFKEQMAILKEKEAGKDKNDCMTAKAKMTYVADLWRKTAKKGGDDDFVEAPEDPDDAHSSDDEKPEPEPQPVAKTTAQPPKPAAAIPPKNEPKSKFVGKPGGGGGNAKNGKGM